METIGMIGGMGWESPVPYYRHSDEPLRQRLGGRREAQHGLAPGVA